jgi:hypothetical protein
MVLWLHIDRASLPIVGYELEVELLQIAALAFLLKCSLHILDRYLTNHTIKAHLLLVK